MEFFCGIFVEFFRNFFWNFFGIFFEIFFSFLPSVFDRTAYFCVIKSFFTLSVRRFGHQLPFGRASSCPGGQAANSCQFRGKKYHIRLHLTGVPFDLVHFCHFFLLRKWNWPVSPRMRASRSGLSWRSMIFEDSGTGSWQCTGRM